MVRELSTVAGASKGIGGASCIYTWPITLIPGSSNLVEAVGVKGGNNVTDSLAWIGAQAPASASIIGPSAEIASGAVSNGTAAKTP